MKQKSLKSSLFRGVLMLLMLFTAGTAWAESTVTTYTFNSKSWGATCNGSTANWTGSKDGNQYSASSSPIGVQILAAGDGTTVTSPKSFTNVSKVVVNYSSSGKGVGSIKVSVGGTDIDTKSISKSQSKVDLTYEPTTNLSGNVVITCNCTTNSYALVSVSITEETGGDTPTPTTYTVAIAKNIEHGTVTASPTSAAKDATITLTATPDDGYEFGSWNVKDASSNSITVTDNKFKMPASNVTVSATFNEVQGGDEPSGNETTVTMSTFEAISGNVGGDANVSYLAEKGGAGTAPAINNEQIRVYQNGGLFTVSAKSGYKLQSVKIGSAMATSVNYKLDGGSEVLTANHSIAANDKYEVKNLNNSSIQFICKGTTSTSRLYVNYLSVTYVAEGDPGKTTPTLSFANSSYNATIGETFTAPTLTNEQNVPVSYSSSNTGVATVNSTTGAVEIVAAGTTTIKASFAGNETYNAASASYTLKVTAPVVPLTTMDKIFEAATTAGSTATDCSVTFNNWVVSGVKGNNAYVTDNAGKGFIVYASGHGFEVGDILSGTVACKVQLYRGAAELTALTSTTEGLTVTKGGVVTPVTTIALASLSGVNTGAVLSYENLQYDGTNFTDGETPITPYNTFITLPTLVSGKKYNVTGVYIQFNTTKEIAPRTGDDIKLNEVINNYTVNIATPENGTITIETRPGGVTVNDGDEVAEGTLLSITCTPESNAYRCVSWEYKEGDGEWTSVYETPIMFTMPAANVQFRATFELIPTYTVAWSVNGEIVKSETLQVGTLIEAPTVDDINGVKFVGWAKTETVDAENPEMVTPMDKVLDDATYYAVFAKEENSGEASLSKLNGESVMAEGDDIVVVAESEGDYYVMYQETVSNSYVDYRTFDHEPVLTDVQDDDKKSWTLTAGENNTWILGDATNGYLQNSSNNLYANADASTPVTIAWDNNKSKFTIKNDTRWIACRADLTGANQYKFRGAGNQSTPTTGSIAYFDIYRLSTGSVTYSDYTTTFSTITLAATDGENYYATFSGSKDVKFMNAEVLTVTVDEDNKLSLKEVEGNQVPADNGVLIKSANTTVAYVNVEGAPALGGNMLYPASKAKEELSDCKFYMLAYKNGTKENLGFYYGADGGAAFVSRTGSAYLAVPNSVAGSVKGFTFEGDDETAIESVSNDANDLEAVYNLAGQRVQATRGAALRRGIYIQNGKKVLVK